ncbi:MAG: NAD-dependent epimerase/dehydratase family protein [Armatimonadota bacterium]|nr:NAD-dependent epimerase/dehydratase family protein [Armatimonadota bacterium]MDR7562010.1 NAD-dependent epimerase/dehydratase family protein [Armatimonadota bacterium]MDR7567016.1 NAD-dependent epimerase/dehydratase family protein [Armatimonadota bacterium]MDR7602752.1 NAD-dependent epimerase/dehydratase family protein [Armatimonadota bacterium]
MKVLVTGGAGFVGSHVVEHLLRAGHEVVVVDDLRTGRRENLPPGVRLYALDILDPRMGEVFEQERPQVLSHHAAQASVAISLRDPELDARVNVVGTLKLLQYCVRTGVRHFVFASTGGAIYGEATAIPCPEDYPPRPISPYGVHKLCAEHHLLAWSALYGLRGTVLRYGNVYGPRQDPEGEAGVVAIFTATMLRGRPPVIFGDGLHTRDYVYVEDVAEANLRVIERGVEGVYNIGTGVETSTRDLFDLLRELVGYRGEPVYGPPRPGDVRRIALDCRRASEAFGWHPRTPLREGLSRTVAWFRSRLGERP